MQYYQRNTVPLRRLLLAIDVKKKNLYAQAGLHIIGRIYSMTLITSSCAKTTHSGSQQTGAITLQDWNIRALEITQDFILLPISHSATKTPPLLVSSSTEQCFESGLKETNI